MSAAKPAFLDRRGASDRNRQEWLAERRQGVTATEVAMLGSYKTKAGRVKAFDRLASEKLDGDPFDGNQYTDWGSAREAVLEEWAEFSHGFQPESRITRASQNPRHLASIDGWRVDAEGVHLAEHKTAGKSLTMDLLVEKGYVDQCQWQMYVTDAVDALVFWEERVSSPSGFVPGDRGTILIKRDDKRIAQLIGFADEFLVVLDQRMSGDDGTEDDPILDDAVTRLQNAKATVAELDPLVRQMMTVAGKSAAKTSHWVVTYEAGEPKPVPDPDAFAAAHPDDAADLPTLLELQATAFEKAFPEEAARLQSILDLSAQYTKPGRAPNPTLRISLRKDA